MLKQTILAVSISLAASSAFAHEIPVATAGQDYIVNMGELSIDPVTGVGSAKNILVKDNELAAFMFDVTTAGSLDVFTDDHNDTGAPAILYVFKQDADHQDWTLYSANYEGERIDMFHSENVYGVPISGYFNNIDAGRSDPGLTQNFEVGTYVAFSIINGGYITNMNPESPGYSENPLNGVGVEKLSSGFTWAGSTGGLTGFEAGLFEGYQALADLYVRASAGSNAVFTVAAEPAPVPVPGAVWLMGSVLAGFGAIGRKKALAA